MAWRCCDGGIFRYMMLSWRLSEDLLSAILGSDRLHTLPAASGGLESSQRALHDGRSCDNISQPSTSNSNSAGGRSGDTS